MPSQEEYLDNILQGIADKEEAQHSAADGILDFDAQQEDMGVTPETLSEMTLDDIDEILTKNQSMTELSGESAPEKPDLMELLSGDSELEGIHDLLEKNDRDEVIDTGIFRTSNDMNGTEADRLMAEMEQSSDSQDEVSPKERKRQEKEAKRLAARQAREAKKAAKKAQKEATRQQKQLKKTPSPAVSQVVMPDEKSRISDEEHQEWELLITDNEEMSDVDSLFSDIDSIGVVDESGNTQDLLNLKEKPDELKISSNPAGEEYVFEDDDKSIADIQEKGSEKKKKNGLFQKILDFLTEEDEEDEDRGIILSEENESILRELDGEEKTKKKSGRKKKSKKTEENDEVVSSKGKKKKADKPKKIKLKEAEESEKKLSSRRVGLIFLICLSFGAALLVLIRVCNDFSDKQEAKVAYEEGDYKTCYQNLNGKYLTETEKIMFGKSESILRIRLWIREYELFVEEQDEEHALDCLIQAVNDYPDLYDYSAQWNAVSDVSAAYSDILHILDEKYHLSEEQAKMIAAEVSDIEYSRMLYTILDGGEFGSWDKEWKPEIPDNPLDDLLPEESGLGNTTFYK